VNAAEAAYAPSRAFAGGAPWVSGALLDLPLGARMLPSTWVDFRRLQNPRFWLHSIGILTRLC